MRTTLTSGLTSWWASTRPRAARELTAVWSWWIGELEQLLPPRIRALLAGRRHRIYLLPQDQEVTVLEGLPEQLTEIGKKPLADAEGLRALIGRRRDGPVLLLPPEQLLTKSIVLPAGVGEDLESALELEMDRQTPFKADAVYFDFSVRERSSVTKKITIDLVLTPKARLDALLARLAGAGIEPVAATGLNGQGSVHPGNLLPLERAPVKPIVFGMRERALAGIALGLLAATVVIPMIEKRIAIESLLPQVAAARESAREGNAIRSNIESLTTGTTALIDRKDREPTTIRLLDEITHAIPDHTWIERIEIRGQEIQLRGQSPSAAELISLLEANEAFGEPQFRSPVTQVQNSDRERFHISVIWTGARR